MNDDDSNYLEHAPRDPAARFELRSYVTGTHIDAGGIKQASVTLPSGRQAVVAFDRVMLNDWPDDLRWELDP